LNLHFQLEGKDAAEGPQIILHQQDLLLSNCSIPKNKYSILKNCIDGKTIHIYWQDCLPPYYNLNPWGAFSSIGWHRLCMREIVKKKPNNDTPM
jgi:hypothetical protein